MAQSTTNDKALRNWTNDDILSWIPTLGTLSSAWQKQLTDAIADNAVTGKELLSLEDWKDASDCFGIPNKWLCKRFHAAIQQVVQKDEDDKIQSAMNSLPSQPAKHQEEEQKEEEFEISIFAQNETKTLRNKATTSTYVYEIQQWYKDDVAVRTPAKDIRLYAHGKLLPSDKQLGHPDVNIVDEKHLITVFFKTPGGLAYASSSDADRARSIKFKKYGIQKSSKPDCLMGYDDTDYIDRADIGCGHAMAARTMYKYVKQVLEKDPKTVAIPCPMCLKTLDWQKCTQIADMNRNEYLKWTGIIEQRRAGDLKKCPHCKALCQRKEGVLIFRMRCTACGGSDWCWNCLAPWTTGGLIYCGRSECPLIQNVDKTLAKAELFTPKYLQNVKIPRTRACPMCLTFIEHKEGLEACKHINRCVGCGGAFCFVCLGIKGPNGWPCNSHTFECPPAPVQSHKNQYGKK